MAPSEEGKLNAMHTAYVMLHCDASNSDLKSLSNDAFWTLHANFFKDKEVTNKHISRLILMHSHHIV